MHTTVMTSMSNRCPQSLSERCVPSAEFERRLCSRRSNRTVTQTIRAKTNRGYEREDYVDAFVIRIGPATMSTPIHQCALTEPDAAHRASRPLPALRMTTSSYAKRLHSGMQRKIASAALRIRASVANFPFPNRGQSAPLRPAAHPPGPDRGALASAHQRLRPTMEGFERQVLRWIIASADAVTRARLRATERPQCAKGAMRFDRIKCLRAKGVLPRYLIFERHQAGTGPNR